MMRSCTLSNLIATCFGIGRISWIPASGSVASLCSILPWYFFDKLLSWNILFCVLLLIIGFGCYFCHEVNKNLGIHDHQCIVFDEFIGMWFVLILSPNITSDSFFSICVGFLFFRVLDICKPWPISFIDKKIGGGIGIIFDDILAAIISIVLIFLGNIFLSSSYFIHVIEKLL